MSMVRIPKHVGVIPDGNRRWAQKQKFPKEAGYAYGLQPGLRLLRLCKEVGVAELTFYGFTQDNTKRPSVQVSAFQNACIEAVNLLSKEDGVDILVLGETRSPHFPEQLLSFTQRKPLGEKAIRLNLLVNYDWEWDLNRAHQETNTPVTKRGFAKRIHSSDISRIDMIIRWGGCRRLSGFLPVQSVYADFFVVQEYWPEFMEKHFFDALSWYQTQDVTLGG